jgi:hypothetical protein
VSKTNPVLKFPKAEEVQRDGLAGGEKFDSGKVVTESIPSPRMPALEVTLAAIVPLAFRVKMTCPPEAGLQLPLQVIKSADNESAWAETMNGTHIISVTPIWSSLLI